VDIAPVVEIKTYNKHIENQEWVCVMVKDNGIGIPLEHQRKIFESMYRVPTGNLHNVKGFGLGLSYTRAVILKHGGNVRLNSAPGKGSEFILEFPVLN
jgi:two-component system phosphate regulon sensor histidine kinase PhoR